MGLPARANVLNLPTVPAITARSIRVIVEETSRNGSLKSKLS